MRYPDIEQIYELYKRHRLVTTDSRKIPSGSIFFALKGDHFNGNQFAESAISSGAAYAIIDDEGHYKGNAYILVKDVLETLQNLSLYHRKQLKIPVIGLTGSNGKTTTKELVREVLLRKYKVLATAGNLNNHIGVPLTLLAIGPEVEIAVIEMGANHVGEIRMLCELSDPDLGLITNIGRAHIGEFGSYENIIKAKGELYDHLRQKKGLVFVSSSNELLCKLSEGMNVSFYGSGAKDQCKVQLKEAKPYLVVGYQNQLITTQLIGGYNYENVAVAIAIGQHFGVPVSEMKAALEGYQPSNNRSQVIRTASRTLVMDAYNANPSSMKAALKNFFELDAPEKWMILGDMLELGVYEDEEHRAIVDLIPEDYRAKTLLVGERFKRVSKGIKELHSFSSTQELSEHLANGALIPSNAWVLIKGSRGIGLEKVTGNL